jgi:GR25 family glycosyltransferase involved in LPS biosynthesis
MKVSLICACKNRLNSLRVSLSSWLQFEEIKEIIIVDWSSDKSLNHLANFDPKIKIVNVLEQKYFNQPQPLNLAASLVTGDYILKVDTDYIINPYFNFFEKYKVDQNTFVSGHHNIESPEYIDPETGTSMINYAKMSLEDWRTYINSYSHYFKYLTGLLFITKENFIKVGGYNETLQKYYAFEDDEICQRLELMGLNHTKIEYDHMLIHLPHPDSKRIENFEGFTQEEREETKKLIGSNLWQHEYYLSQMHIKKNKELCSNIVDYCVHPKINWEVKKIDEQIFYADKVSNLKLSGMGVVNYISLEENANRRENFENQFSLYDIKTVPFISKRFSECNDVVTGKYVDTLNKGTKGCVISHLRSIQRWYETTDEDYGFFAEDDLSLETVPFWDFTWEQFIDCLPEDAECVQLLTIRGQYDTFKLRERYWDDWGATAYIITRDYAKKLIDTYIRKDSFHLEIPNSEVMPLIENILFASVGKSYVCPLFVEDVRFESTFVGKDDDVKDGQKKNHYLANQKVLEWWKNNNKKDKMYKTELEQLLHDYSLDTENPDRNFNLGVWYENGGHTAPALSYFLRCAERADEIGDKDLAYEALIRSSYCYEKQGTRDGSAKSLLEQAVCLLPNRPEAYFLLSRFAERRQWWQDCYIYAKRAMDGCDFDCKPLRTNVEYPGKYGLLFERSIAAWWWGKADECRELLLELINRYDLSPNYKKVVNDNLVRAKVDLTKISNLVHKKDFSFKDSFDWGDLTYEDKITIDREIIHEQVYRFWRDVKENDIVVDIGASVGPFVCSILDNKPKKVYCVEPSKSLLTTLKKNCDSYLNENQTSMIYVNHGIVENLGDDIHIFGKDSDFVGITFNQFIQEQSIDKINFLKIDCEGGEYNIFNDKNIDYLLNNVEFIAMEVHLNYENCREKFKNFRDKYLTRFINYKVMSCTRQNIDWGKSIDIKDRIFDDKFVDEYACEFMIYIYN